MKSLSSGSVQLLLVAAHHLEEVVVLGSSQDDLNIDSRLRLFVVEVLLECSEELLRRASTRLHESLNVGFQSCLVLVISSGVPFKSKEEKLVRNIDQLCANSARKV